MLSRFSNRLTKEESQEMLELIHGFRKGILLRSAQLMFLNHYLRRYQMEDKIMNRFISSVPLEMGLMPRV